MNSVVKFRLLALGAAVGLMGLLIVFITLSSRTQTDELRSHLTKVDSESYTLADNFRERLREVNTMRLREAVDHNPATWQQFSKASQELDEWLASESATLTTPREKEVLHEAKVTFDDYVQAARDTHVQTNAPLSEPAAAIELAIRAKSQRLADLGRNLEKAHHDTRNQYVTEANDTLERLRRLVFCSLALLFVFGLTLAGVAYRDMIVPLRVKLVESQELVERNEKLASLGMLAAGVAHEIRNPLTAIKAAVFMQQKKFQPGSLEHSDSQLVQREILRLERIVTEFLKFARPSEPQPVRAKAQETLQEVQKFLAPELARSNIQLIVGDVIPAEIKADTEQIKQVLINLVQNAADSIERDGTITLRAHSERKTHGASETKMVVLEVSDTGKGISPEVAKRLFDPFFTTKSTGTGLGLSIAAALVQKNGGALQYQTQPNRGTTFGIVLPEAIG